MGRIKDLLIKYDESRSLENRSHDEILRTTSESLDLLSNSESGEKFLVKISNPKAPTSDLKEFTRYTAASSDDKARSNVMYIYANEFRRKYNLRDSFHKLIKEFNQDGSVKVKVQPA